MAVDLNTFKMSFPNGVIRLNDKQYTSISAISGSISIDRSAVYGTGRSPQGMSSGQASLGEGSVTFSDAVEAHEFISDVAALADQDPSLAIFAAEYIATSASGASISKELVGCAISEFSFEYENGSDALSEEIPFHFLRMKVDGKEVAR